MSLDPGAARVLRMLAGLEANDAVASAAERRQALRQLAGMAADPPAPDVIAEPLTYRRRGPRGALRLRRYRTRAVGEAPGGLIVYLHGGGWVAGDLDTHDGVCRTLVLHSGCQVIAADYRRPPEHPFPAAVDDAIDVAVWARARARAWGADPSKLVLAGDSAGGNLAAVATGGLIASGRPAPALLVLLCPILDLAATYPSRAEFAEGYFLNPRQMRADLAAYLGAAGDSSSPLASPMAIADVSGFPPTHLHLAQYDPFRDEGLAFTARLIASGVPAQAEVHAGMIHYFYALPRLVPAARPVLAAIGAEVAAALGRVKS